MCWNVSKAADSDFTCISSNGLFKFINQSQIQICSFYWDWRQTEDYFSCVYLVLCTQLPWHLKHTWGSLHCDICHILISTLREQQENVSCLSNVQLLNPNACRTCSNGAAERVYLDRRLPHLTGLPRPSSSGSWPPGWPRSACQRWERIAGRSRCRPASLAVERRGEVRRVLTETQSESTGSHVHSRSPRSWRREKQEMIRGEELNTVEPLKRHHFWVYKMSPETEKLNNASKEMRLKTKTIDVC